MKMTQGLQIRPLLIVPMRLLPSDTSFSGASIFSDTETALVDTVVFLPLWPSHVIVADSWMNQLQHLAICSAKVPKTMHSASNVACNISASVSLRQDPRSLP